MYYQKTNNQIENTMLSDIYLHKWMGNIIKLYNIFLYIQDCQLVRYMIEIQTFRAVLYRGRSLLFGPIINFKSFRCQHMTGPFPVRGGCYIVGTASWLLILMSRICENTIIFILLCTQPITSHKTCTRGIGSCLRTLSPFFHCCQLGAINAYPRRI